MLRFAARALSRNIDVFRSPLKRSRLNVQGKMTQFNCDSLDLLGSKSSKGTCNVEEELSLICAPAFWKHLRLLLGCSGIP